jgi:hypothetical protein
MYSTESDYYDLVYPEGHITRIYVPTEINKHLYRLKSYIKKKEYFGNQCNIAVCILLINDQIEKIIEQPVKYLYYTHQLNLILRKIPKQELKGIIIKMKECKYYKSVFTKFPRLKKTSLENSVNIPDYHLRPDGHDILKYSDKKIPNQSDINMKLSSDKSPVCLTLPPSSYDIYEYMNIIIFIILLIIWGYFTIG